MRLEVWWGKSMRGYVVHTSRLSRWSGWLGEMGIIGRLYLRIALSISGGVKDVRSLAIFKGHLHRPWILSQNRPNYKSSSVETIDQQSSFQTWAHIIPVVNWNHEGLQTNLRQTNIVIIQHNTANVTWSFIAVEAAPHRSVKLLQHLFKVAEAK